MNYKSKMSASTPILKSNNVSPIPSLKQGGGKEEPSVPYKKVRVPTTLPSKYGKFIQFGYFFMNKLNASVEGQEEGEIVVDEKVFLDRLRIFESLPHQQAFVQEFFDSAKTISVDIRKLLQQHKKNIAKVTKAAKVAMSPDSPDKPQKEKKTRQSKKQNVQEDYNENPLDTVHKKPRGKAKKVPTSEDQLVNELVQLAAGPPSTTLLQATHKQPTANIVNELLQLHDGPPSTTLLLATHKQPNPKPVKQPKPKPVKQPKPNSTNHNHILHVSIFEFNQQKYLIDDLLFVYDFHSQNKIGQFINNQISLF